MRIKSIQIQNFRKLHSCQIDFSEKETMEDDEVLLVGMKQRKPISLRLLNIMNTSMKSQNLELIKELKV